MENGGILSLAAGNTGSDLTGTIHVKSGGVSKDLRQGGRSVWKNAGSTGSYIFDVGAKAYVSGDAAANLLIGPAADATLQLVTGTFSNTTAGYALAGDATFKKNFSIGLTAAITSGTLTIANGVTLTVEEGGTLDVENVAALTVEGIFDVAGTLNVTGDVEVKSGGEYDFQTSGRGTSTGNITVKSDGIVLSVGGSNMDGTGWTVVEAGGKAYTGTSAAAKVLFIGSAVDSPKPIIELANGTLSTSNTGYVLAGEATLNGEDDKHDDTTYLYVRKSLLLEESSTLNIPGGVDNAHHAMLTVSFADGGDDLVTGAGTGRSAAKIVLDTWGYLGIRSTTGWISNVSNLSFNNFYENNGSTKVAANSTCNKTFTRDAGINGWKAGN